MRVAELNQLLTWQATLRNQLRDSIWRIADLLSKIAVQIATRRAYIAQLRKQITGNIAVINALAGVGEEPQGQALAPRQVEHRRRDRRAQAAGHAAGRQPDEDRGRRDPREGVRGDRLAQPDGQHPGRATAPRSPARPGSAARSAPPACRCRRSRTSSTCSRRARRRPRSRPPPPPTSPATRCCGAARRARPRAAAAAPRSGASRDQRRRGAAQRAAGHAAVRRIVRAGRHRPRAARCAAHDHRARRRGRRHARRHARPRPPRQRHGMAEGVHRRARSTRTRAATRATPAARCRAGSRGSRWPRRSSSIPPPSPPAARSSTSPATSPPPAPIGATPRSRRTWPTSRSAVDHHRLPPPEPHDHHPARRCGRSAPPPSPPSARASSRRSG